MLVRMLPPLLQPMKYTTPADEAAFVAWADELTRQLGVIAQVILAVCAVAWWPVDGWVMADAADRAAFGTLRVGVLVVVGVGIALLWSPLGRRHARLTSALIYAGLLAAIGSALGPLGTDGLTWLANAFLGIVPSALIPVALGGRIALTTLQGAALVGSFLVTAPPTPGATAQVSFGIFAVFFTILAGEILLRVLRRTFFQKQALDRANAELSALSGSLAEQVAEQTRQLRNLARHLDRALEAERRRIARDLHDDLGQLLTAIRYTHARLDARLPERADEVDELLADLGGLIDGTSQSVRGFLTELRPRVLDDYGLPAAAEWLAERLRTTGVACTLEVDPEFPGARYLEATDSKALSLDPEVALVLFRVLQEATTNALKHGQAQHIALALRMDAGHFVARVQDDGVGFDPVAATEGFGLLGLRERISAAGGALSIQSAPGATSIEARF